jgi:hypothetical protein
LQATGHAVKLAETGRDAGDAVRAFTGVLQMGNDVIKEVLGFTEFALYVIVVVVFVLCHGDFLAGWIGRQGGVCLLAVYLFYAP